MLISIPHNSQSWKSPFICGSQKYSTVFAESSSIYLWRSKWPEDNKVKNGWVSGGQTSCYRHSLWFRWFPIFRAISEVKLKEADFKNSRPTHDRICSKALYEQILKDPKLAAKFTEEEIELFKLGEVPENYSWHHQEAGRMHLVDYETHRKTGHTGGYKIWEIQR